MIENISNFFIGILLFLDGIIYSLISWVYQIILVICQIDILDNSYEIDALVNRIYVIIGVIVLFLVAYSLLKSMVNPDDALKNKKGPVNIIKDIIISIVLIALVPTIFSFATRPVIEATAACQFPQPRGANNHEMPFPTIARMLLSI